MSALGQQRSKDCADPPGGRITCEDTQAAVCNVTDGKVDGYCRTPPSGSSMSEVQAKILSIILDKELSAESVQRPEYQRILKAGRAEVGATIITFKLPDLSDYVRRFDFRDLTPTVRPSADEPAKPSKPVDKPPVKKPGVRR